MMLAYRLVRLIENHSERLAEGLLAKLQACDKCRAFNKVPPYEFRQRVYEIYHNLGEWLLGKKEEDIARRYIEIGRRRQGQGVPLHELLWAIMLTREFLLEYLKHDAVVEKPAEVFGELEMLQMLESFFDYAIYYAAVGYAEAGAQHRDKEERIPHGVGR